MLDSLNTLAGGETAYVSIDAYLNAKSTNRAKRLLGETVKNNKWPVIFKMDNGEKILDVYKGVKLQWKTIRTVFKCKHIRTREMVLRAHISQKRIRI